MTPPHVKTLQRQERSCVMMDLVTLLLRVVGLGLLMAAVRLIYPILFPPIVKYPWPAVDDDQPLHQTVVIAGSFNPPHYGHLELIKYLAKRYRKVYVVVGMNPAKHYPVSPHQRAKLLQTMLQSNQANSHITVQVVSGYIWRTVKQSPIHAQLFVRGIRTWDKDGKEERQLQILNTWGPLLLGPLWWPLPTLFLQGNPTYAHVSSTLIRNLLSGNDTGKAQQEANRRELERLVPQSIVKDVAALYGKKDG